MTHRRAVFTLAVLLASMNSLRSSPGAADTWDGNGAVPPNGNWETGINWADNSTPGNGDTATFGLGSTYSVTFGVAPAAIQALTANAGTVTFQSSGGAKTLSVTPVALRMCSSAAPAHHSSWARRAIHSI